jgi:FAD binding domain-containing protein/berberine-like enzyme
MTTTLPLSDCVLTPGDAGYDAGHRAWNLNAEHHPAAVVMAQNAHDVAAAVHLARGRGVGVGVLATGHGSTRHNDGVLVNTSQMRGVRIDPARRTASVEAGAVWSDVIAATAPHGLTGLPGSSPGVGVVGFTLGGGFGWLGRRHGLASHSVTRAEVVTADGELVVAGANDHAELLWGLSGGTDNFGIVTSLEFELHPVEEVYGGNLYYPLDRARELLTFFAQWSVDLPVELTCAATFRSFPNLPVVPHPLRGGSFVAIRGAFCGDPCEGETLLDQARAVLGPPVVDTFARMPVSQMGRISMDPVDPLGAAGATELVRELTPELVDTLVRLAGPESQSPLVMLELRTLGGALGGSPDSLSPMAHTAAAYTLNAVGLTSGPGQAEAVRTHLRRLQAAVRTQATGETYLNFLDLDGATPERVRAAYSRADWSRLVGLKDRYDPDNVFRFNRNVPPSPPHPSRKESN